MGSTLTIAAVGDLTGTGAVREALSADRRTLSVTVRDESHVITSVAIKGGPDSYLYAAPGDEYGSVVVVGHAVDSGESAFNDITAIAVGDAIQMSGGEIQHWYRVSSVETLPRTELAAGAEDIFAQEVPGRLVIVTCDDWDGTAFRSNVVVTAEVT